MKAIIMAGGEGKRLKPITGSTPKPLVPLCGRPVMEHIILLLRRHGITDICAALKYRPGDIKNYFGSGEKLGVRLEYRVEQTALGTAGGVKNCADFYGSEDFLVISGDAACDIDLSKLIAEHQRRSPCRDDSSVPGAGAAALRPCAVRPRGLHPLVHRKARLAACCDKPR